MAVRVPVTLPDDLARELRRAVPKELRNQKRYV